MTRARDVANVLSTATALATDTETAAAISTHNTSANGHSGRGTTANRPQSPTLGDLYFDTSLDQLITYSSTGWSAVAPVPNAPTSISATLVGSLGASVSFTAPTNVPVSSYTVTSSPGNLTATGSSSPISVSGLSANTSYTFTVKATGSNGIGPESLASNSILTLFLIDYLVVAGGGSGGGTNSGGGGAGGLRSTVTATGGGGAIESAVGLNIGNTYTIEVGAGGASVAYLNASTGNPGTNSSISGTGITTVTSTGGGGGGNNNNTISSNTNGGSGGGAGGTTNWGTGTNNQGFNGGSATSNADNIGTQGGGGGAGAVGGNADAASGAGGAGVAVSISGSSVTYAGGGGGGAFGTLTKGAGGSGGGGAGGDNSSNPGNGSANTGGGGGGSGYQNFTGTSSGGSGVVILRYSEILPAATSTTGSPTITQTGGYRIYKFTSTGSITL